MLKNLFKKIIALSSVGVLSAGLIISTNSAANADDEPVISVTQLGDTSLLVYQDMMNYSTNDWDFSPNWKMFAATYWGLNKITIYDVGNDGSFTDPVDTYIGEWALGTNFSPDGNLIAYYVNGIPQIKILKVNSDRTLSDKVVNQVYGNSVQGLAFSPDGSLMAVQTYMVGNEYMTIYEVDSNGVLTQVGSNIYIGDSTSSLTFSPNGKFLFYNTYFGKVSKWDVGEDGTLSNKVDYQIGTIPHGRMIISPDGNLLAIASGVNTVSTFHINVDGTLSDRIDTQVSSSSNYTPSTLSFSPNGNILAVGGSNYIVSLFRVNPDGTLDGKVDVSTGSRPNALSFSTDGSLLARASQNNVRTFSLKPYKAPPIAGTVGTATVLVDSSITLTIDDNDNSVNISEVPGATDVTTDDNQMSYTVATNNLDGYTVTIKADQSSLVSETLGNSDVIPVNLIEVSQNDSQNGSGTNATELSSTNDNLLYSQNQRSIEGGDSFISTFSLTEVPFVNADDYTGTVTYTATAN